MRYAYNEAVGNIINGVIFYFEPGDECIAEHALDFLVRNKESPTSIVWAGQTVTVREAHDFLMNGRTLDGNIGIRFTIEREEVLLGDYLTDLAENYPPLTKLMAEIWENVLPPSADKLN